MRFATFNFAQLHLLCPILFICGLFFHVTLQTLLAMSAAALILFPFSNTMTKKLILFSILGLLRGTFIDITPEPYSYKRTSFSANIVDLKIKEHGIYVELENLKFIDIPTRYNIDTRPVFPKSAQMLLAKFGDTKRPSKILPQQIDPAHFVTNNRITAIGRFLLPTPPPLPQLNRASPVLGLIDEYTCEPSQRSNAKIYMRRKFDANLSPRSAQLAKAILLGDTFAIDQATRAKFQDAGIAHLLGVSVLNIAILGMIFYYLFRWFINLFFFKAAYFVSLNIFGKLGSLLVVAAYCYVVGFEYPLLRSLLMSSFAIIALYFGRSRMKEMLLWSAALILCANPEAIYNIGFQLSFGAVLGLTCARQIHLKNKVFNAIAKAMYSTFFASLVIIPISIYQFHTTSIQPYLANIIAIPFVSFVITPLSFITMALSCVNLEYITASLLDYAFVGFVKIAEYTAPLGLNIHVDPIYSWGCLILMLCIALFSIFQEKIRYIILLAGIACFCASIATRPKAPLILIHPYATALILEDKIIAYPKCNFIAQIWAQAYNRKCEDGKNTPYFYKEKCGKLVVNNKYGLIYQELKGTCALKTKNYIVPYSQQIKHVTIIELWDA